jgi:hypothetical protein
VGEDPREKTGEPDASPKPTSGVGVAPENIELDATPTPDEARVVAAYLRRRSATVEAIRLEASRDLLEAVGRVAAAAGDGATPLS